MDPSMKWTLKRWLEGKGDDSKKQDLDVIQAAVVAAVVVVAAVEVLQEELVVQELEGNPDDQPVVNTPWEVNRVKVKAVDTNVVRFKYNQYANPI
jgi:radical SAM superfamily enzyme